MYVSWGVGDRLRAGTPLITRRYHVITGALGLRSARSSIGADRGPGLTRPLFYCPLDTPQRRPICKSRCYPPLGKWHSPLRCHPPQRNVTSLLMSPTPSRKCHPPPFDLVTPLTCTSHICQSPFPEMPSRLTCHRPPWHVTPIWRVTPPPLSQQCTAMMAAKYLGLWGQISRCCCQRRRRRALSPLKWLWTSDLEECKNHPVITTAPPTRHNRTRLHKSNLSNVFSKIRVLGSEGHCWMTSDWKDVVRKNSEWRLSQWTLMCPSWIE